MKRFVITLGVIWAVFGWLSWLITPHRGFLTALDSALLLAPSYLLLAAYRGSAIPMRAFVMTALSILVPVGLRIIPGRYDMAWAYLLCPPIVGLSIGLVRFVRKRRPEA